MELKWIRVEDEKPVDNGRVQVFLVCTDRPISTFENCEVGTCFFTDRFHPEESHLLGRKITHWARIEKPKDLQLDIE